MYCLFVYLVMYLIKTIYHKYIFCFTTESEVVPSQSFITSKKSSPKKNQKLTPKKKRSPKTKRLQKKKTPLKKQQSFKNKQPQEKNKKNHKSETESEDESEADLEEAWKQKNRSANSQSILEPIERNLRSRTKKQTV